MWSPRTVHDQAAVPPRRCYARSGFERPRNKGGAANCGLSLMKLPPDHNSRHIRPPAYCVWKIFEWEATAVGVVFAITLAWKWIVSLSERTRRAHTSDHSRGSAAAVTETRPIISFCRFSPQRPMTSCRAWAFSWICQLWCPGISGQRRLIALRTHLISCRSQRKHLLWWPPQSPAPPALSAHLPRQFAALSSHCHSCASAGEQRSIPVPMRVIAKKSCRVMVEPPEKGAGPSNLNLSTGPNPARPSLRPTALASAPRAP